VVGSGPWARSTDSPGGADLGRRMPWQGAGPDRNPTPTDPARPTGYFPTNAPFVRVFGLYDGGLIGHARGARGAGTLTSLGRSCGYSYFTVRRWVRGSRRRTQQRSNQRPQRCTQRQARPVLQRVLPSGNLARPEVTTHRQSQCGLCRLPGRGLAPPDAPLSCPYSPACCSVTPDGCPVSRTSASPLASSHFTR